MSPKSACRTLLFVGLVVAALAMLGSVAGADPPPLGQAEPFAVLAGATVTNTGPTIVFGDLGVSPGTAVTGGPDVRGTILTGPAAAGAKTDAGLAYDHLAGEPCPPENNLTGQDLGGKTLKPGVYCFSSSAQLTGTLTLDFQGNPDALFVFQIGTQLTTASGSVVRVINAPGVTNPCNVFWQVGSLAELGTNSVFLGTIIAGQSITAGTGTDVMGRLLALVGQVSLNDNTVTRPPCAKVVPTVDVQKTATPTSLPEPGGNVTYEVRVTNSSAEVFTITSLTDLPYGDLTTLPGSTCTNAVGTVLQPGGTYTCTFTAPFTGGPGDTLTDVATVTAANAAGVVATDFDDAVVTITPVAPVIQLEKTANPLNLPEPGGSFTFTVVVVNPASASETVTIQSLTDDVYGDLSTQGTCTTAIGTVLGPGESYTCTFTGTFFALPGTAQTDIVTVNVVDDDGQTATDNDDAVVTITNVVPTVLLGKSASPTSRPEPGGTFAFTVVVTNTSRETVTITSLNDNVYGNLNGRGTCATGAVLAPAPGPGNTYTCTFQGPFFADAGASQTDTATAVVVDQQGSTATAVNDATVTITNLVPTIDAIKLVSPGSLPAPGGTFTFTVRVINTSSEPVTITSLVDDVYGNLNGRGTCAIGAVVQPGASYNCSFRGEFTGSAGATQTDTVTAIATDNEGSQAQDQAQAQARIDQPPLPPAPTPPVSPPASPVNNNNNNNLNNSNNNNANSNINDVNVGGDTINIVTPSGQIVVIPVGQGGANQTQTQDQTQAQAQPDAQPQPQAKAPVPGSIALTGSSVDRGARLASASVMVGLLLIVATLRSGRGPNLGLLFGGPGGGQGGLGRQGGRRGFGGWPGGDPGLPGLRRIRGGRGRGGGAQPEPMAFSGPPMGVLPRPACPPIDGLDAIFRPPGPRTAPNRPAPTPPPTAEAKLNVLASGLGLTAGPPAGPAVPPAGKSAAAKGALLSLGFHLRR